MADPFLPVPDPDARPDRDVLPADDRLEMDRVDDGTETAAGEADADDIARPALFKTPAPGEALDREELRRDLDAG